jgi:hypothetical protein
MQVEVLGTAILVLVIFALSDPDNTAPPETTLVPFFVSFTVAVPMSPFAPLTQAGWNPARDFGPRLVALLAGFGSFAIPGPRGVGSGSTSSGRSWRSDRWWPLRAPGSTAPAIQAACGH